MLFENICMCAEFVFVLLNKYIFVVVFEFVLFLFLFVFDRLFVVHSFHILYFIFLYGHEFTVKAIRQHVHFLDVRCATIEQQRTRLEATLLPTCIVRYLRRLHG